MSKKPVSPVCVYTIVHTDRLENLFLNGRHGEIAENRNWATANRLLQEAQRNNMRMLVIFAAAEHTGDLIYYANLEAIKIHKKDSSSAVTTFRVSDLTPFEDPKPKKTSLIVKSTDRAIPDGHIRPYVICKTPIPLTMLRLNLRTYRYGSPRDRGEGLRIGTTRYLPRGVFKTDYALLDYFDVWLPVLAPSRELLQWAKNKERTHEAFAKRYENEMKNTDARQVIKLLAELARTTPIAIGCFCADESRCHRSVLYPLILQAAEERA